MIKNIIVIPARYKSTRFPGKVLVDLKGKPIIQYVYEQCLKSKLANKVIIATDHQIVVDICQTFTKDVIMTSEHHQSGTDRIAEVVSQFPSENVVNIQGDEPFISPCLVDSLFEALKANIHPMVTAYHRIDNFEELDNPNIVKVIFDSNQDAIYFSRFSIPYLRPPLTFKDMPFYRHIGVYGYKSEFLQSYVKMPHSSLEKAEQLEQLRVIEAGYKIKLIETADISIGIDTPNDLELAKKKIG